MLSVIIATLDSERALVPTLSALVPGATAGLVSDVLVVDGGSRDDTAAVADVGGCNFLVADGRSAGGSRPLSPGRGHHGFSSCGRERSSTRPGSARRRTSSSGAPADARAAVFRRAAHRAIDAPRCALPRCRGARRQGASRAGPASSPNGFYDKDRRPSESAADPEADLLRNASAGDASRCWRPAASWRRARYLT